MFLRKVGIRYKIYLVHSYMYWNTCISGTFWWNKRYLFESGSTDRLKSTKKSAYKYTITFLDVIITSSYHSWNWQVSFYQSWVSTCGRRDENKYWNITLTIRRISPICSGRRGEIYCYCSRVKANKIWRRAHSKAEEAAVRQQAEEEAHSVAELARIASI